MKTKILTLDGKSKGEITLPKCFSQEIRKDIIAKILEVKKNRQPYSPSLIAGKQASASGKIVHGRHVWKSQYGRGWSRIPRKIILRRGSQFNMIGAVSPNTRGGRRAYPPKILSMINTKRVNKKELKLALISAISATANKEEVIKKYGRLKNKKIDNLPLVAESKLVSLKTKELISSLKKILGKDLFELALKKKKIRAGKGKLRGRKYRDNSGLLIVTGKDEKLKTNAVEGINVKNLGVTDLAKGGTGRLTLYTEQAIKNLGEKLK